MYLRMEEARPGVTWTLKGRRAIAMASSLRVRPGGLGARGIGAVVVSKLTVISEETSRHRTGALGPRRARTAGRTCRWRFPRRGCGGHEELWREQTAQKIHGKMRDDARSQALYKGPHGRE